jgi:RNA polymerase sigma factor (sigma-70 family)
MAAEDERWQHMIAGLRAGDSVVLGDFCRHYGELLHSLAQKHLPRALQRRVGPEDVVQSVCRTFLMRAQRGEFQLTDGDDLWGLLCAITLTKVREQTRYHLRQRRGLDREQPLTPGQSSSDSGPQPVAPGTSPAEAAAFADQFQQLIAGLDEEERQVVDLKLQNCTHEEIATRLGCSERTVRRLLKRVQAQLERAFEVE